MRLAPGKPYSDFQDDPLASPEVAERLREKQGLNEPIIIQYGRWLAAVVHGDLGRSYIDSQPVTEKILRRLPATLQLAVAAHLLGCLGLLLGILAASRRGTALDHAVRLLTAGLSSVPHWWLGLMLLVFVAAPLRIFPMGGMYTIGKEGDPIDRLWHLLLPALVLCLADVIVWSRYIRAQVVSELGGEYIRMARAKGASERRILFRHVLPNALLPAITIFGELFAGLLSGAIIVESVFSWPGLGRLMFQSAGQRDYPVVLALVLCSATLGIVGTLVADVLYSYADPRIQIK